MLTILTWWWGDKYPTKYVRRLAAGLARNIRQPFRLAVVADIETVPYYDLDRDIDVVPILDLDLIQIPGCLARLRMFDPAWQRRHFPDATALVSIDLDAIVTDGLDATLGRREDFVILTGANAANPCPYNGSLFLLRPGTHAEVWHDFSLAKARRVPRYEIADDQAWLWAMIPNAAGWRAGPESGVYAFQKPGWPPGKTDLPVGARLVAFPGWRDPAKFEGLPWIKRHWVGAH